SAKKSPPSSASPPTKSPGDTKRPSNIYTATDRDERAIIERVAATLRVAGSSTNSITTPLDCPAVLHRTATEAQKMARRNITARQRAWLAAQLDSWRSDGIVSDDQSARI